MTPSVSSLLYVNWNYLVKTIYQSRLRRKRILRCRIGQFSLLVGQELVHRGYTSHPLRGAKKLQTPVLAGGWRLPRTYCGVRPRLPLT